jgi:glyoxylase-like metal-dependent hydrolase (beta-lactamase superfamily II)
VAREAFGRLEKVGEGLHAFVSTPLTGDYTTVSNGGIIAGKKGVVVVEAFQTPEGARWMARRARELTGRWPTHVVVTHYHGDHSTGLPGFSRKGEEGGNDPRFPSLFATERTRRLTIGTVDDEERRIASERLWADILLVGPREAREIDLGDRTLRLVPRRGHTDSDLTVELPEDGRIWCGDLVWNGMFPNYMDAIPSALSRAVRALRNPAWDLYVPGHGPLADTGEVDRYVAVVDRVEEVAREAHRRGWTASEAAGRFTIPAELGEWTLFNPSYFRRAVEAWLRELS